MKKLLSLTLSLCLALSMTACGAQPSPRSEVFAAHAPAAEEISYEVTTDLYTQEVRSDDDTLLMTISFALPHLVAYTNGQAIEVPATPAQQTAAERADTFNQTFAQWQDAQTTESYIKDVKDWYQQMPEFFTGTEHMNYCEDFTYTTYRLGSLISVAATYYSYLGGAHPNTVYFSWNYDLDSGAFLSIPELAGDPQAFTLAVADLMETQATARFQNDPDRGYENLTIADVYWNDYRTTLEKWASDYAASFDEDGLNIIFSPYDLAPYAEGAQSFHVSYSELDGYWSESGRTVLGLNTAD